MAAPLAFWIGLAAIGAGPGGFNKTVAVGTDTASIFLFHPDDLAHRSASPAGWMYDDFACGAEFRAGALVAFTTGGDGGFGVRVTDGELTARERAHLGPSWRFRYKVGRRRVLLDGGDQVPSIDRRPRAIAEGHWVEVPDGDYEVTVGDIRYDEDDERAHPGDKLPGYVAHFRKVKKLADTPVTVAVPPFIENLRPDRPPGDPPSYLKYEPDLSLPLKDGYLALVTAGAFAPHSEPVSIDVIPEVADLLERRSGPGERRPRVVLVDLEVAPRVGMLVEYRYANRREGRAERAASFAPIRPVRVLTLTRRGPLVEAEVAPLTRPRGRPTADDLRLFRQDFARFAAGNAGYRKSVRNPDYRAEEVSAIESPAALVALLMHLVPLSPDRRQELWPLSDAALLRAIRTDLQAGAAAP